MDGQVFVLWPGRSKLGIHSCMGTHTKPRPTNKAHNHAPMVTRLPILVGASPLSLATCTTALSPMDVCSPTVILFTSPVVVFFCFFLWWWNAVNNNGALSTDGMDPNRQSISTTDKGNANVPRSVAPYQTEDPFPMATCPMTLAVGATKAEAWMAGDLPACFTTLVDGVTAQACARVCVWFVGKGNRMVPSELFQLPLTDERRAA